MTNFEAITDLLKENKHYDSIINLLESDDYIKIASTTYDKLVSVVKNMPSVRRAIIKNETITNAFLKMGNEAFSVKGHEVALQYYNLALLYAPCDSYSFFLTIYKRSLLFCDIMRYSAAFKDMDVYLRMDFNDQLSTALVTLRDKCKVQEFFELVYHNNLLGEFNDSTASEQFFKLQGNKSPKYHFASSQVDIVIKDGEERIVATSDIKIGEIVAIERSYVLDIDQSNKLLFCYYCNTYADNLLPCNGCSSALFCNELCRFMCWKQYHEIECAMSQVVSVLPSWYSIWLKYVLKTWKQCNSLEEFLEISSTIDACIQNEDSTFTFDMNNKRSYLMAPTKHSIKKYGKLYDASLCTAVVIHGLKSIDPSILNTKDTTVLIENIAKQILYSVMHVPYLTITGACVQLQDVDVVPKKGPQKGVFPFLSRLKHSCAPNMMTVGLRNKVGLICTSPVKAGAVLTAPLTCNEFFECPKKVRLSSIYQKLGYICNCMACNRNWDTLLITPRPLALPRTVIDLQWVTNSNEKYKLLCQSLKDFSHTRTTKEYITIYKVFVNLVQHYQHGYTKQRFQGVLLENKGVNVFYDYITSDMKD